jgi:hypothetical protein
VQRLRGAIVSLALASLVSLADAFQLWTGDVERGLRRRARLHVAEDERAAGEAALQVRHIQERVLRRALSGGTGKAASIRDAP